MKFGAGINIKEKGRNSVSCRVGSKGVALFSTNIERERTPWCLTWIVHIYNNMGCVGIHDKDDPINDRLKRD